MPNPECPICERGGLDDPEGNCQCPTECECGGRDLVVGHGWSAEKYLLICAGTCGRAWDPIAETWE